MIDARRTRGDGGDGARRDRGAAREGGATSTPSSRSSDGSRCSKTSRTTRSTSCSPRSAPPTRRPRRSTTWSHRRSARSRAPTSPCCCRGSPPGTRPDGSRRTTSKRQGLATARAASAREMLVVCGTESEPWSVHRSDDGRGAGAPCAGSIRMPACERVRVQGRAASATRLDPAAWQSAIALGRRARRAPDRRSQPSDAGSGAHATRWSGRSSAVRSRASRPCATDSRRCWWRWRPSRRPSTAARRRAERRHGGSREGRRRAHGAHRGQTLPAGARRHRLHDGASRSTGS